MKPAVAEPTASEPGCFRRLIDLSRRDEQTVVGWMEDEVHHFGVTLIHDGERVVDAAMAAVRFPYTTCGGSGLPFRKLIGVPLQTRSTDIGRHIDMRLQCTHLYDLAALLVAFASSRRAHRRFEATVSDRAFLGLNASGRRVMGPGSARLCADGVESLAWGIDGETISAPAAWAGCSLMEGFRARCEALPPEQADQAFILRRAISVANGRTAKRYALPRDRGWPAVCHTFQPHVRDYAERIEGLRRNFAQSSEGMLAFVNQTPASE